MSANPITKMIPVTVELPLPFDAAAAAETISELRKTVAELKELIETSGTWISMTEEELADYFGISLKSLKEERCAGKIKYKRVKGKIHYSRKHIEDYLNSGN